ncbi:hypothetical protein SBADM41S_00047 [Streptomyces badius]
MGTPGSRRRLRRRPPSHAVDLLPARPRRDSTPKIAGPTRTPLRSRSSEPPGTAPLCVQSLMSGVAGPGQRRTPGSPAPRGPVAGLTAVAHPSSGALLTHAIGRPSLVRPQCGSSIEASCLSGNTQTRPRRPGMVGFFDCGQWRRIARGASWSGAFRGRTAGLRVSPGQGVPGVPRFPGWYFEVSTGGHMGFESWLERLMALDFAAGVVGDCHSVVRLLWDDGEQRWRRAPDCFVAGRRPRVCVLVGVDLRAGAVSSVLWSSSGGEGRLRLGGRCGPRRAGRGGGRVGGFIREGERGGVVGDLSGSVRAGVSGEA